jgi:hypothetical protein
MERAGDEVEDAANNKRKRFLTVHACHGRGAVTPRRHPHEWAAQRLIHSKGAPMNRKIIAMFVCLLTALPVLAQSKEEERLQKSATVLQEILGGDKGLPVNILDQAECVLIFPSVKKVAIGFGSSYGRGALVCRKGAKMDGSWGAPAMYTLDRGSLGVQLGTTATDFVLVIVSQKGVEQILNGKATLPRVPPAPKRPVTTLRR